jgi:predicted RNA binding protein YcfA (HicA-like mRNA interferase family)
MKARQMLRLLCRIGYVVDRQQGSHRILVAEGGLASCSHTTTASASAARWFGTYS